MSRVRKIALVILTIIGYKYLMLAFVALLMAIRAESEGLILYTYIFGLFVATLAAVTPWPIFEFVMPYFNGPHTLANPLTKLLMPGSEVRNGIAFLDPDGGIIPLLVLCAAAILGGLLAIYGVKLIKRGERKGYTIWIFLTCVSIATALWNLLWYVMNYYDYPQPFIIIIPSCVWAIVYAALVLLVRKTEKTVNGIIS